MPDSPSPRYQAEDGREDRHGEMTGAISFNMVFVFLFTTIWTVGIAPLFLPMWATLVTGLGVALGLTAIGIPISRKYWAMFSHWMDEVNRLEDEKNQQRQQSDASSQREAGD